MEHMLSLFVRSIFVDNMIFAFFLGMCSYLAVSKNVKTALGLGVAVTFVLCVTVPVDYLLQTKVLAEDGILGMDLSYLAFILFIAVIAGMVQLVEMVILKPCSLALRSRSVRRSTRCPANRGANQEPASSVSMSVDSHWEMAPVPLVVRSRVESCST